VGKTAFPVNVFQHPKVLGHGRCLMTLQQAQLWVFLSYICFLFFE